MMLTFASVMVSLWITSAGGFVTVDFSSDFGLTSKLRLEVLVDISLVSARKFRESVPVSEIKIK